MEPDAGAPAAPTAAPPGFDAPVETPDILALAAGGVLAPAQVTQALARVGLVPDAAGWALRWTRLLAGLATLLALAGVICIVAANWQQLGRLARFGGALAVLAAVVGAALWAGLSRPGGRWLLTLAIGLIGPLLALYGQTYQTGADVHGLMFTWALLALPWMVASRFAPAWVLVLAVLQGACLAWLAAQQAWAWLPTALPVPTWIAAAAVEAVLLLAWEAASARLAWLGGRGPQRLIATALLVILTAAATWSLFDSAMPARMLGLPAWAAAVVGLGLFHLRQRPDLSVLATVLASVTFVAGAVPARFATLGPLMPMLASVVVLAVGGGGAAWLRRWQLDGARPRSLA